MRFFVATRSIDIPPDVRRFASVDGSVPGATVTWNHHVSGELVNLDAMPERFDPSTIDAVGTTSADTDAVASAVTAVLGGRAAVAPELLRVLHAASHWCDLLGPDAEASVVESSRGRGLHEWVTQRLARDEDRSRAFEAVTRELLGIVVRGEPIPSAEPDPSAAIRARALVARGRVVRSGVVALADLTGEDRIDPIEIYAAVDADVVVVLDREGPHGRTYTVGVNPTAETKRDLRPALDAIAIREHAHGPPALAPTAIPGSENWGGRASVFGSPWNYGSRLAPNEVLDLVVEALGLPPTTIRRS